MALMQDLLIGKRLPIRLQRPINEVFVAEFVSATGAVFGYNETSSGKLPTMFNSMPSDYTWTLANQDGLPTTHREASYPRMRKVYAEVIRQEDSWHLGSELLLERPLDAEYVQLDAVLTALPCGDIV